MILIMNKQKNNSDDLCGKTINDYLLMYLRTDELVTVGVIESYRGKCLANFEIGPCYTYSIPGLTWIFETRFN